MASISSATEEIVFGVSMVRVDNTNCHRLATDNNALAHDRTSLHHRDMFDGGSDRVDVAARLLLLRRAHGFDSQSAFAQQTGLGQSEWNHFESGRRPLPLSAANKLRMRWRVTLDWLYFGDRSGLSMEVNRLLPPLVTSRKSG